MTMQREDVERVKAEALTREDEYGEAWVLASDYAELLDRAERAEAAAQQSACEAVNALGQAHDAYEAQRKAEAERDAAFAAGQAEMRERAYQKCLTMDGALNNAGACAMSIRALPIKDKPDDRQ